jgi:hypothetical protein
VSVVVPCASGGASGGGWGGVSVSVAVYLGGVLGRGGAGAVVSVDGLACACGMGGVVWVSRMWIEQGFRWLKRGCFGWHRCRAGSAVGLCWLWLVYALGCLLAAREGLLDGGGVGLWDRRRRSARVLLLGLMSLVVKCWRAVLSVDSEILCFSSGGEPK